MNPIIQLLKEANVSDEQIRSIFEELTTNPMMAMATNVYGSSVRVEERSEESNDSEEEENRDAIERSLTPEEVAWLNLEDDGPVTGR